MAFDNTKKTVKQPLDTDVLNIQHPACFSEHISFTHKKFQRNIPKSVHIKQLDANYFFLNRSTSSWTDFSNRCLERKNLTALFIEITSPLMQWLFNLLNWFDLKEENAPVEAIITTDQKIPNTAKFMFHSWKAASALNLLVQNS